MTEADVQAALGKIIRRKDREEMRAWRRKSSLSRIRTEVNRLTIPQWAEKNRKLPKELSPFPGPFRFDMTPWLIEIGERMSSGSDAKQIDIIKAARGGFTVGLLENYFGYTIAVEPNPVIYVTADEETMKMVMKIRISRMINLSGLGQKIFAQASEKGAKGGRGATGNTAEMKEFPGGFIMGMGPNSGAKARDRGAKHLIFDETEAAAQEIHGEGSPLSLLETRTKEWWDRLIVCSSTPKVKQTSHIEPRYLAGDQRKYFFDCPRCGHRQTMKWDVHRLHYEKDDRGELIESSVWYECQGKGCRIVEADKYKMLQAKGHGGTAAWEPTAVPDFPGHYSYFWPGVYSLFYTWADVCREWTKAQGNPLKLQTFINTTAGETWEQRGEGPPAQDLALTQEGWESERLGPRGTVVYTPDPDPRIRVVVLAADVQGDRIEAQVVGFGRGKETWSLGYHVLYGDTTDPKGPVWNQLREIIAADHAGRNLDLAVIDAGFRKDSVYAFCDDFSGVLAIKGTPDLWQGRAAFILRDVIGYSTQRADLNDGLLKQEIYGLFKRTVDNLKAEGIGFGPVHFPGDYPHKFYEMATAEQYKQVRSKSGRVSMTWDAGGKRNEALDTFVYALGALYILAQQTCLGMGLDSLDWNSYWDFLDDDGTA